MPSRRLSTPKAARDLAEHIHHDDEVLRISRPPHGIGFALLMTRVHLRPVIHGAGLACVLAAAGVFAGVL